MKTLRCLPLLALLVLPASALAQSSPPRDRVVYGGDVYVGPGEVVRDAVAFGGDARIEGEVTGDAVAFGGSVLVAGEGLVRGDTTSLGGTVASSSDAASSGAASTDAPSSREAASGAADARTSRRHARARGHAAPREPTGPLEGFFAWVKATARSAMAHALLFLLGLLLIGTSRERLRALQTTMIRDGAQTVGVGLLGYVVSVVAITLLALSLIGIPVAVVFGLALPLATYLGLAAAATVLGAALPFAQLQGREIAQLGAGVLLLFVSSLVPVVGTVLTIAAACLGFGALIRTRFSTTPPDDLPEPRAPLGGPVGAH